MATGTTPNYSLSYPLSTDPVNVAADVQELAEDLDTFLTAPAFINNLAINAGSLVTSSATAALFNTGATTLNIGGAATTINVGASAGQVNVRGNFNIGDTKVYEINDVTVLSATTLGSSVVSSSLTAVGTLTTGTWNAGNILLPLGASSSPSLAFTGDTNTGMWSPTADTVAFSTGGSERLRITSAGNVGIGTSSPEGTLHLSTSGDPSLLFRMDNYNATGASGPRLLARRARGTSASPSATQANDILLSVDSRGYGATAFGSTARVSMGFYASENFTDSAQGTYITFSVTPNGSTANTERMRIDNAGNVGIGTSSPQSPLSVGADGAIALQGTYATGTRNRIRWLIEDNTEGAIIAGVREALANAPHSLTFSTRNSSGALSERMRIDSAGNVGIAVNNPIAKLQVDGHVRLASNSNTQTFPLSSPAGGVHIYWNHTGGSAETDLVNIYDNALESFRFYQKTGTSTASLVYSMGTSNHIFYTGNSERMRIDSAGVINITGSQIVMESGTTGAPTDNVSFKVERGTSPDVEIRWNETGDGWQFTNDGTTYYDIPTAAGAGIGLEAVLMFAGM